MNALVTLVLFVLAFCSLHLGLGLVMWLAALIAAVLALCGVALFVVVLDGDGSPW
jgi:hypothetical protein